MAPSGENGQGPQHDQLTEEVYRYFLDSLGQAGWAFAAGEGDDLSYQISIVRNDGRGNMSPEEAIDHMRLVGDDGNLLPGYEVTVDEETGQLALGYEGPGDNRYEEFLNDVVVLGIDMDAAIIKNSPYPEALEQWRRRQTYMHPESYESLEPHVSDNLKDLRDHVVFKKGGVTRLMELLAECTSSNTIADNREQLRQTAKAIETALATESPADRDAQLDIGLQDTDSAVMSAVERYEVRALGVLGVTEAFAREVLVEDPLYGREPVAEDDLAGLLVFEDGPEATKELKTTRLGKVLYHMHSSIEPRGILMMFYGEMDFLDGKTPREVIDSGLADEYKQLLDWAVGLRGMTAS